MEIKTEKEVEVKKDDLVEVIYNEKSAYHKAGEKELVHRICAKKLEKKGIAKIVK